MTAREDIVAGWSWRRFLTVWAVFLGIGVVVLIGSAAFSEGWRSHLTLQTRQTDVTVVSESPQRCGRSSSGERQEIAWTDGDGTHRGWFLACHGDREADPGDTISVWVDDGGRAFPGSPWNHLAGGVMAVTIAAAVFSALRARSAARGGSREVPA